MLVVNALRARLSSLTPREGEVLLCVIGGALNKQIAAQLGIAEKTVKNYVSSLLAKLGLERRTQAAVLASRLLRHEP